MSLSDTEKHTPKKHQPPLWHRLIERSRAHIYRSSLYMFMLNRRFNVQIVNQPFDLIAGKKEAVPNLLAGKYHFGGRTYQNAHEPWTVAQNDKAFQHFAHGFEYLYDLKADGSEAAVTQARQLLFNWINLHGVWSHLAWRYDVMATRLLSWMQHEKWLISGATEDFIQSFHKSFAIQVRHLMKARCPDYKGEALINVLWGQLLLSLFVEGFDGRKERALQRFTEEVKAQILPDGGHISRNPEAVLRLLKKLEQLLDLLADQKVETPQDIRIAIDRMAPFLRTFRHGDGTLALFQGSQEGILVEIERVLEASNNQGQPLSSARHSAYERLQAGPSVILMDVGKPAPVSLHPYGHASVLAFEMSSAMERIIVNCGAMKGGEGTWHEALGATAAHSALVVDNRNILQLYEGGGVVDKDINITCERIEENGHILINASHDGYKEAFGLIHHRSVYLNKEGTDLRCEDVLTGNGGSHFEICLHLHPDVHTSLVSDEQSALLKLQSGAGWHLKVQGVKIKLQESIYIGQGGQMRHTDQLIIHGPLRGEGATVKWRLGKIG